MDLIENLPVNEDAVETAPAELKVLQKYFENVEEGTRQYSDVKIAAMATLVYLLVSNPYFDKLLSILPHMMSPIIRWGAKAVIFFILIISTFYMFA